MSSSETSEGGLSAAASDVSQMADHQLQVIFARATREVARRMAENDQFKPLPETPMTTINDVMLAVTGMLHAMDVQVFELSMWQAFTGRTAAPNMRHYDIVEEDLEA